MLELTVAQALVRFLSAQEVERDGVRGHFFAGRLGIFGHGNVAGLGQALAQYEELLPYHPARNEQAMVHVASGYARQRNRLGTYACTTSVGPGATNLVTGGDDQSVAGVVVAWGYVCVAASASGAAAVGGGARCHGVGQ